MNETDRVAKLLLKVTTSGFPCLDHHGRNLERRIEKIVFQIMRQGLSPSDFDRPEGLDALRAIAGAIVCDDTERHFSSLPIEWRHVINAAWRIFAQIEQY